MKGNWYITSRTYLYRELAMTNIGPRAERLFEQIDELIQQILEKEKLLLIHPEDIWQWRSKGGIRWSAMGSSRFEGRIELDLNEPQGIVDYTFALRLGGYLVELRPDDTTVIISRRYGYSDQTHEGTFSLGDAESCALLVEKIRWFVLRAFTLVNPLPRVPEKLPRGGKQKPSPAERRREKIARRRTRRRLRAISRRR